MMILARRRHSVYRANTSAWPDSGTVIRMGNQGTRR